MEKISPSNLLLAVVGGIIPLTVYLLTIPTDLTLGIFGSDSGELITASLTNGIPHPSGYPTWLLTSKVFGWLPIGRTLAHRYNLFSAVCTSLSMLILTNACCVSLQTKDQFAPFAAVLAIAFTLTVWSQAVITEVYALNGLMVSLLVYLLTKVSADGLSTWRARCIGLTCGLTLTTHLTSILLLPAVGLIVLANLRPFNNKRLLSHMLHLAYSFMVGLTPFLLLFWRAGNSSPIIWGDSRTFTGWWWLASGTIYRPNVFALSMADIFTRLQTALLSNPIDIIPLLIPLGAILGISLRLKKEQPLTLNSQLSTALLFTAGLYTLYALSYNTSDWRVFLIPATLCLAVPLANGLARYNLKQWGLTLPLLLLALNLPTLLTGQTDNTRQQAEEIFTQAPADAILLTDGRDETIFPLWYFRYAEGIRPDILIVDQNLFAFDWYRARLASQYPQLKAVSIDDLPAFRLQNSQEHPVCETSLHPFALSCTDR